MGKYVATVWGETYSIEADWTDGASPVVFDGICTQYQARDFDHSSIRAAARLLGEHMHASGDNPQNGHHRAILMAAVQTLTESTLAEAEAAIDKEWPPMAFTGRT